MEFEPDRVVAVDDGACDVGRLPLMYLVECIRETPPIVSEPRRCLRDPLDGRICVRVQQAEPRSNLYGVVSRDRAKGAQYSDRVWTDLADALLDRSVDAV